MTAATADPASVAEDLLEGVQAIAGFLNWSARKVYRAREEGWTIPIRKREGLGLYAFRSELEIWLKDASTLPTAKAA
ncbi:hypothetical protein [Brevundimonas sp.]|uniref:hypothetical protein n=1 Tax=Brevundimonas sp. TaxID=1871086 RepID=UPI00286B2698|nr:hypothetical protein [Brevundimonas sp.]